MRFTLFFVIIHFFLLDAQAVPKDWPVEAKQYLKQLPGQKLTLDFVVGQALEQADVFDVHKADYLAAQSNYLQVIATEDLNLYGSHFRDKDRSEPFSPFEPVEAKGWTSTLGVKKFFSTGTGLSVEGTTGRRNILLSPLVGGARIDQKTSQVTLGLEQNLLSDFFGSAYRSQRRAAEHLREAQQSGAIHRIEKSVLDVIELYYTAWLNKQLALNSNESMQRRNRLLRIARQNRRRGTVEESDLLQIENLALGSKVDYDKTHRFLEDIWESLVISLKMPRVFLKVNPMTIPIVLDDPVDKAIQLCRANSYDHFLDRSKEYQQAKESLKAAESAMKSAEKSLRPDVKLQAQYTLNGVDPKTSETYQEIGNADHPGWSAGIAVSFPLQNNARKSRFIQAKADYERAKASKSMVLGNLEAEWRSLCATLKNQKELRDQYKVIYQKNKRRVGLDDRRFRIGRIRANEWVQTEDEEAQTNLAYQESEVELRKTAWLIQKKTGELGDELKKYLKLSGEPREIDESLN